MASLFEQLEVIDAIDEFEVNNDTRDAILESFLPKNIHIFKSVDELFNALNEDDEETE